MSNCEWLPLYICSNKDAELFDFMLESPDFNCFEIDPDGLPLENDSVIEDLKRIREKGKKAFVRLDYLVFEDNDKPYHCPKKSNWKAMLDSINQTLCEVGGEAFIGYYFDEPFYYMTGDEYLELTEYLSRFKKRIFSIHGTVHIHQALWPVNESHDFEAAAFRNMSTITPENHKYTTDVSYDYYGEWEKGVHHNTVYRMFIEKMGDRFENTNFWFCPPIGTVMTEEWNSKPTEEVEQICIDVFMGMWNWAKKVKNFGGFAIYTYLKTINSNGMIHAAAKDYILPDLNGEVKWKKMALIANAVIDGFNKGLHPAEIELPQIEYDKGYIV